MPGLGGVSAILEACRGAGRRAPAQLALLNLASGLVQGANLRASDYQKPLPDSAGHARTSLATSADTSGWSVLVLDVDGRSG
jgi:hypothetical protein